MIETSQQIAALILTGAWFILTCTIIELLSQRDKFSWKVRWPGVLFALLTPASATLVAMPLKSLWAWLGIPTLVDLPIADWFGPAAATLAMLLFVDFLMYWEHRFEHRFMWPVHAVHHSTEHLSAATSYNHPLQYVPMFLFISVPLSVIDFGSFEAPYIVSATVFFLQLFIHSPVKITFGPLRHLFVDPAFHRVHHSLEERHFDRNFSILFSFWDRLFGTMVMPARDEWPATGIHESRSPRTIAELLVFPFLLWRRRGLVDQGKAEPRTADLNAPVLRA